MNKGRDIKSKALAAVLAASMVTSVFPVTAFAVTGDQVAKDGTYTATKHVVNNPEDENEWTEYDVTVSLTVADGKFSAIEVTPGDTYSEADNKNYLEKAVSKSKGFKTLLEGKAASAATIEGWDTVSTATRTSTAVKEAAQEAIAKAEEASSSVEEGYVYGTVNLPYADFYYGEINDVKESADMNLTAADPVDSIRDTYDVVSSATGSKWKSMFADVTYSQATATGGEIIGLKDVNIAVPKALYNAAKEAIAEGKACRNKLLDIVGSMTVTDTQPAEYKVLNGDGTLTALKSETVVDKNATATITTSSRYGNYQVNTTSEYLTGSNSEILGVIFETSTGAKYGMQHLENIWRGGSQVSFAVKDGFKESHGNTIDAARTKALEGATITKITFLIKDKADVIVNTNLLCKNLLSDGQGGTASGAVFADGVEVPVTLSVPSDSSYKLDSLTFGRNALKEGTDYTLAGNTITIKATDNTGIGSYTAKFTDAKYADISVSFVLKSAYADGSVKLEGGKLVLPEGLELAAYLNSISSLTINGKSIRGLQASALFNEDGSVNPDAAITNRDGSTTPVFEESGTYEIALTSVGYPSVTANVEVKKSEYKYVYAALTWAEFWESEGVYAAGSTEASSEADSRGELDKGAFDTVSRATANHGLHRGSFQSSATIVDTDGNKYEVAGWNADGSQIILTDGSTVGWSRGTITKADGTTATMDHYEVTGMKYVPVKVKSSDFADFAKKYTVVENGGALLGGYSEQQLAAYNEVAAVTDNTNGLKEAVKNSDGSFTFSARKTGTDSGLKDKTIQTASAAEPVVKDASGSYGEFLRVDINGEYGGLGAGMYAVRWDYYGNDSTYGKVLASYGTKFAADNWMHKSMGVQLGLTDSLRCQLPEGTDGTGYWALTVYSMGYSDYTYKFQATEANIVKTEDEEIDTAALKAAIEKAEALDESLYSTSSWAALKLELDEAKEEIAKPHTQATVDEALAHLNAAIDGLEMVLPILKLNNSCPASYKLSLSKEGTNKTKIKTSWDNIAGVKISYQWYSTNSSVVKASTKGSTIITKGVKKGSATCICLAKATLPDGTTATTAHAMTIKVVK